MTSEQKPPVTILSIVERLPEPKLTPDLYCDFMLRDEKSWLPSKNAARLTGKIQTTAVFLGFVNPSKDDFAHTLARKTPGDAAFRQLYMEAEETMFRALDLEKSLERTKRIASGLRKRLKAAKR